MARNVLVLKNFESPKEAGVYYRLICLTGSNKGEAYILMGNRIVIGRSEKADIRLSDTKASREHAEITRVGSEWIATDLGSQNGISINDKKITQQALKESDKLIVGQSVFKFAKVEVTSKNRVIKEAGDEEGDGSNDKKSMIPFIVLILIFVSLFLFDDFQGPAQKPVSKPIGPSIEDVSNDYAKALKKRQANEDKVAKSKLNTIYQRGLREYREGNYFRAIHEFNLALIISPGDAQAEFYLRKTKEDLDRSIASFNERAQRDENSLKYQSAIVSYCSIVRLLYSVPEDPRHKNAEKKIKDLETKLGMESGETNCLKKQRTNQ